MLKIPVDLPKVKIPNNSLFNIFSLTWRDADFNVVGFGHMYHTYMGALKALATDGDSYSEFYVCRPRIINMNSDIRYVVTVHDPISHTDIILAETVGWLFCVEQPRTGPGVIRRTGIIHDSVNGELRIRNPYETAFAIQYDSDVTKLFIRHEFAHDINDFAKSFTAPVVLLPTVAKYF